MNKIALLLLSVALTGCTSMKNMSSTMNGVMTPSLKMTHDKFDDQLMISQPMVPANSSFSDDMTGLGFAWKTSLPKFIILSVGAQGITNVTAVKFNVDGKVIDSAREASQFTDYADPHSARSFGDFTGNYSVRRFVIPISDFVVLANGKHVKMKIESYDEYQFSVFGKGEPAAVSSKFAPFLKALADNKAL